MDNIRQVREDINKSSNVSQSKANIHTETMSGRTEVISMKPVSKFRNHLESQYLQSLDQHSEMVSERYIKGAGKQSALGEV